MQLDKSANKDVFLASVNVGWLICIEVLNLVAMWRKKVSIFFILCLNLHFKGFVSL